MRVLFLISAAAAVSLAGPVGAQRQPARVSSHTAFQRGIGASFWWDADTLVTPRVQRYVGAATAAVPEDEAIVRLQPNQSATAFALRHGLSIHRALSLPGVYVMRADPSRHLTRSLGALTVDPALRYAEANRRVHIAAVPNDPSFSQQWGFSLAQFPAAWDLQKGTIDAYNTGVVVGVIDTGISPTHPDLRNRIAPGGRNFVSNSADTSDDNGHGTHVSGTIAATTDNGVGVAGGAWQGVQVLPIKAFDAAGDADISVLAQAITFAGNQGLKVVNLSAGTPDDSPTKRDAMTYFLSRPQHPIMVTAAGNDSDRTASVPVLNPPLVPARYPDPRIIGVAGVGRRGEVAWYSDGGAGVDIAAPGGNSAFDGDTSNMILSTNWSPTGGDTYGYLEGTSMAAPHVTAAVALLLSEGLKTDNVESVLYRTATGANGTRNNDTGYGLLNTRAALDSIVASAVLDWPNSRYPVETTSTSILGQLVNSGSSGVTVAVDGKATAASVQTTAGAMRLTARAPVAAGAHSVTVTAPGALTGRPRSSSFTFTVRPKVLAAGWHMFSLPYAPAPAGPAPGSVFNGQPFKLDRWMAPVKQYAMIDASLNRSDPQASFAPSGAGVSANPVGLGYWVYLPNSTTLSLAGDPVIAPSYSIPLAEDWNQVGDPYVFPVHLSLAQFSSGGVTMSVPQALAQGLLRPKVYRLPSGGSTYDVLRTSDVILQPWESVWLRTSAPGTLIIPATPAQ